LAVQIQRIFSVRILNTHIALVLLPHSTKVALGYQTHITVLGRFSK